VGEADELTRKINEVTRLLKKHLQLPVVSNDYNFHMFDYLEYELARMQHSY